MLPTATSPHGHTSGGGGSKDRGGCCSPMLLRAFGVLYLAAAVLAYLYVMPHFEPGRGVHHAATSLSAVGPQLQPLVDVFPGPAWRTEQTLASKLLLSDKRMRVESHTVKGEDGKIYDDWIWMDVTDQINVIPYVLAAAPSTSTEAAGARQQNRWRGGEFVVFRQKKYGLRGESLAVAGGQIEMEKGEMPLAAAQRELAEELFLWGAPADWIDLGSYRVNVNRGHGTVSCFLLADAQPLPGTDRAATTAEFKVDELERQRVVRLSFDEMEAAVRAHKFAEIKWAATAALALDVIRQRIRDEDARMALTLPLSSAPAPAPLLRQTDNDASPAADADANADAGAHATMLERTAEREEAQAQAPVEAAPLAHRREMNIMAAQPQQQEPQQQTSTEAVGVPLASSDAVPVEPTVPAATVVSSAEQAAAALPAAQPSTPTPAPAANADAGAAAAPQAPPSAPVVTVLTPVEGRSAAAGLNLPPVPPKKSRGTRRPGSGFGLRSKTIGRGKRSPNSPKSAVSGKPKGSRGRNKSPGSKYAKGKSKKGSGQ